MSEYEILPCPFCGGKGYLEKSTRAFIQGNTEKVALVRCLQCGARAERARMKDYYANSHSKEAEVDAVAYWNRRWTNQK